MIIRPINSKDEKHLREFPYTSGVGIRNLPRSHDQLIQKISQSETALSQPISTPGNEEYFFVLENTEDGRIGGLCGIFATRDESLTFSFNLTTAVTTSTHPAAEKKVQILKLASHPNPVTEICSLYLYPEFRHSGLGRLLSLSRFLFIASHRPRFRNKIVADMRGYLDQNNVSPFWEAIGKHFCHLSFEELMIQLNQGKIRINDILPRYPLYVSLLPRDAQMAIGKTHDSTIPAYNMLKDEGFMFKGEIDALEGGPTLIASTPKIRAIKQSLSLRIEVTPDALVNENEYLIANQNLDFRACMSRIIVKGSDKAIVPAEAAYALNLKSGDLIRAITPKPKGL